MNLRTLFRPLVFITLAVIITLIPVEKSVSTSLLIGLIIVFGISDLYLNRKQSKATTDLLKKIEKVKDTISGTGEQISGSCNQIDQSTQEQSAAVTETSSASNEISSMVEMTSENIKKVSQSIEGINQVIRVSSASSEELERNFLEGKEANQKTISMMQETVDLLNELTVLFKDVTSKTTIINDIVFQTRLLSFNASVEAARAGEHGKGFAVVAEEIGNLAKLSGNSAQDINQTLDETSKKVQFIIEKISSSSRGLSDKIQKQTELTHDLLENFKSNFEKVQDRTRSIGDELISLTNASSEQSKGVSEMSMAIHQVNESINRNTLVVAQTAKLANVLNDEIQKMDDDIKQFKAQLHINDQVTLDEIPWEDRYLIGVAEMDKEHMMILDKINMLIRAMNKNSVDEMGQAYNELYNVTDTHFAHEENHLQKIGYPAFDSHKKIHENLLAKLLSFGTKIENNDLDKPMLASFLRNWLFTHIMGIDVKYAQYGKETFRPSVKFAS